MLTTLAAALNQNCQCRTLNPDRLREQLETDPSLRGMAAQLRETHPHLFSASAVFLDAAPRDTVAQTIAGIEDRKSVV